MGRFLLAILGALFLLIGGGIMLWIGKPTLDAAKASTSWPTVEGTVRESRVETKKSNDRNDGPSYKAVVVYDYQVKDEAYSSDRIWFGSEVSTSKRAQMEEIVNQYVEGEQTTVYYNDKIPSEAVLQPGAFFTSYFMIIFGAVFAVPGMIALLIAVFVMKGQPAAADDPFGRPNDNSGFQESGVYDDDDETFDSNWSHAADDD